MNAAGCLTTTASFERIDHVRADQQPTLRTNYRPCEHGRTRNPHHGAEGQGANHSLQATRATTAPACSALHSLGENLIFSDWAAAGGGVRASYSLPALPGSDHRPAVISPPDGADIFIFGTTLFFARHAPGRRRRRNWYFTSLAATTGDDPCNPGIEVTAWTEPLP